MPMDFSKLHELLNGEDIGRDLLTTVLLAFVVFGTRFVATRFIRRRLPSTDQLQLRTAAQIRWLSYLVFGVGLMFIWAAELQAIALSFVVLAMAFVWATKESIACFQGAIYRMSSDAFAVGDRIQIGTVHGDVINHGLYATTLLEVGPGDQRTGRVVSVPNSLLLTQPLVNDSLASQYLLHVVSIPATPDDDLEAMEVLALQAADDACAEFLDDVRREIHAKFRRHGLNPPFVIPRITYEIVSPERVNLLLRLPVPVRLVREIEQKVIRAVLGVSPPNRLTMPPPAPVHKSKKP